MSKYDKLTYQTLSEREYDKIPDILQNYPLSEMPKCLIGKATEDLKAILNIQTIDDIKKFEFMNNHQEIISPDYIEKCKIFKEKLTDQEKKEFLINYMGAVFGNKINGRYFVDHLSDVFNLNKYELIEEDYNKMISQYFGKATVDLKNKEDKKKFKDMMYPEHIKQVPGGNTPIYEEEGEQVYMENESLSSGNQKDHDFK